MTTTARSASPPQLDLRRPSPVVPRTSEATKRTTMPGRPLPRALPTTMDRRKIDPSETSPRLVAEYRPAELHRKVGEGDV